MLWPSCGDAILSVVRDQEHPLDKSPRNEHAWYQSSHESLRTRTNPSIFLHFSIEQKSEDEKKTFFNAFYARSTVLKHNNWHPFLHFELLKLTRFDRQNLIALQAAHHTKTLWKVVSRFWTLVLSGLVIRCAKSRIPIEKFLRIVCHAYRWSSHVYPFLWEKKGAREVRLAKRLLRFPQDVLEWHNDILWFNSCEQSSI